MNGDRTIWKQELEVTDEQRILMPGGSGGFKILTIQVQNGVPVIWYLCDPTEPKVEVVIHCRGTGHRVESWLSRTNYIGSVQLLDGKVVFHYFVGGDVV